MTWRAFNNVSETVARQTVKIGFLEAQMEVDRKRFDVNMRAAMYATVQTLSDTQRVVLEEYRAAYCVKDTVHERAFLIGQAAALSRLVVKSRLGELALVVFEKCRTELGAVHVEN